MKKSQIFSIVTIVLAALGLILYMFCPGIKADGLGGDVTYSGVEAIFGKSTTVLGTKVEIFKFSFLLFLGFIFAIAGLVITILPMAGVKCKLFPIIAIACFVVAALFAFLSMKCCVLADGSMGADGADMGAGPIVAGIMYIFAACTSALPIVLKD